MNRDKVIEGFKYCLSSKDCVGCVYFDEIFDTGERCHAMIDAVALLEEHNEVIQCKDCKHSQYMFSRKPEERQCVCEKHGMDVTPNWFCADGEKREDSA